MKSFIFTFVFFLLACYNSPKAQEMRREMTPGRTLESNQPKSYPDSAEFAKLFKELYPSIKSSKSIHELANQYYKSVARGFKMQGMDSLEASKIALKNLDENGIEKVYFETYRRNLSAKELKKYIEFIKTPEGKHIAEVWPNLQRASSEANAYVTRTINTNLVPLRHAAREKMDKEHPKNQKRSMTPGGAAMEPPLRIDSTKH
jgi:hypothetical protein